MVFDLYQIVAPAQWFESGHKEISDALCHFSNLALDKGVRVYFQHLQPLNGVIPPSLLDRVLDLVPFVDLPYLINPSVICVTDQNRQLRDSIRHYAKGRIALGIQPFERAAFYLKTQTKDPELAARIHDLFTSAHPECESSPLSTEPEGEKPGYFKSLFTTYEAQLILRGPFAPVMRRADEIAHSLPKTVRLEQRMEPLVLI